MAVMRKFLINEDGAVSVLLAAAMVALVGFAALVVDAGLMYLNRARIVNALDSAVLAGAQELAKNPENALDVAMSYAEMNGLSNSEISFSLGDENTSITGVANRKIELFFARVLGVETADLNVSSKARIAPLTAAKGVVPFGVLEAEYTFGEKVILKQGGGEGSYGWFGALRMGGNGTDVYRNNIKYGYSGIIKIGDLIDVEEGNMSGPTSNGVSYRISQCNHVPECSIDSYIEGCPRICIVPLGFVDEGCGSEQKFRVTGFAAFLIDEYVGSGNENKIKGTFIKYIAPGITGDKGADFGLYAVQLYE